jgi:hypothetical protein
MSVYFKASKNKTSVDPDKLNIPCLYQGRILVKIVGEAEKN